MTEIIVNADCGDSPQKQLLKDLNIAYARGDIDGILQIFSDDIRWQIVGQFEMRGKAAVRQTLEAMGHVVTSELVIDSIIIEGQQGMISGIITPAGGKPCAFCDVCQFTSASGGQIKSMKSYTIEINK